MKLLYVELTNKCNEDCWFCPHSKMQRKQGLMTLKTAETAVKKMKLLNHERVVLNNIGESLLHPKFFRIAEMFKDFNTSITVNARCLTKELVEGLINSSIDFVRVSVDFECDEELVKRLLDKHKHAEVNFKGDCRETVNRLRAKWPTAEIMYLTNWGNQMEFNNEVHSNICPLKNEDACVLLWDGRISNCCFDYEGNDILGTIDNLENIERINDYEMCKNCGGMF